MGLFWGLRARMKPRLRMSVRTDHVAVHHLDKGGSARADGTFSDGDALVDDPEIIPETARRRSREADRTAYVQRWRRA